MNNEKGTKMVMKPAIGEPHAGDCYTHWDAKAPECKICASAVKCADATKKMLSKVQSVPETKPAKAEAAKPVVKPAAPVESPKTTPKPEAAKAEPAKKEEPLITIAVLVEEMQGLFGKDITVQSKEGEAYSTHVFLTADGKFIVQSGISNDGNVLRLMTPKINCALKRGYTKEDLAKALAPLRG
jgi:hypothetical protein